MEQRIPYNLSHPNAYILDIVSVLQWSDDKAKPGWCFTCSVSFSNLDPISNYKSLIMPVTKYYRIWRLPIQNLLFIGMIFSID